MRTAQNLTVIKKVVRRGGEEAAGGAWKVAFADFTMAMMAFFLVLWLISISTQSEREIMAISLRDYSVLNGKPTVFENNGRIVPGSFENRPSFVETPSPRLSASGGKPNEGKSAEESSPKPGQLDSYRGKFQTHPSITVLKDVVRDLTLNMEAQDNVAVEVIPQGLRIRIQDEDDRQMFEPGSTRMDPFFEDVLLELAPLLMRVQNDLIISGHTDGAPYNADPLVYSNWELSSERASMARKVLQAGGVPDANLLQVVGMANSVPVNKDNALDPKNRRIEIIVLAPEYNDNLRSMFGANETSEQRNKKSLGDMTLEEINVMQQLRNSANNNQPVFR